MSAEPQEQAGLYLVHPVSGEVVGREPTLTQALQEIERLESELQDVERDLRGKRAQIKLLLNKLDRLPENYDRRDEVISVFDEWRQKSGHLNSRLDAVRFDAIRRMLEITNPRSYPREAFSLAIDGIVFDPNRKQRRNGTWEVFNDCELVFRSAANMERYIKRAPKTENASPDGRGVPESPRSRQPDGGETEGMPRRR